MRLWDPATGTAHTTLTGHTGRVRALAAIPLPDGRTMLASAGQDTAIFLWEKYTVARIE
ncbi:hypothetical protein [Micromonospora coerulea]|uniref:hypothetical protein n=1 Tax=Micromonospora coerulea TaxID=47856 RepID=UPI003D159E62